MDVQCCFAGLSLLFPAAHLLRNDEIVALFYEVKKIFEKGIKKLSFSDPSKSLLHTLVTLLLHSASKFKECSSTSHLEKSTWISGRLEKLWPELTNLLLSEWIVKYYTEVFGGTRGLRDSDRDIKVHAYMHVALYPGYQGGGERLREPDTHCLHLGINSKFCCD